MATSGRYVVKFRRRREMKTNYRKRLALLLSGKPRLVVRITNTQFIAQIIDRGEKGDVTLAQFNSSMLRKKYGWPHAYKNLPSAYLTGLALGKIAKEKGIKEVVLDIGLRRSHRKGRIYALVKGVLDAGVHVEHDEEVLPDESRLRGEHIKKYLHKDVVRDLEILKERILKGETQDKKAKKSSKDKKEDVKKTTKKEED